MQDIVHCIKYVTVVGKSETYKQTLKVRVRYRFSKDSLPPVDNPTAFEWERTVKLMATIR